MKKFIALLMALVMTMSLVGTAWAEGETDTEAKKPPLVTTVADLKAAMNEDKDVLLGDNFTINSGDAMTSYYGLSTDGCIDGNGKTITDNSGVQYAGIYAGGSYVKNLTLNTNSLFGIYSNAKYNAIKLEKVTINKTSKSSAFYTQNSPYGVTLENATMTAPGIGANQGSADGVVFATGAGGNTTLVTINGGTYTATEADGHVISSFYSKATVTVNGGTFTGKLYAVDGGNIVINGGIFTGGFNVLGGNIVINGGTFDSDVSDYVAAGYEVVNEGTSYKVVEKTADVVVTEPDVSYDGQDQEDAAFAGEIEVELDVDAKNALAAKAADIANTVSAVATQEDADLLALGTNNVGSINKEDVSIVVQTYFAVEFKGALDADDEENPYGNCFVLDITPKCSVVATTANDPANIVIGTNAVELENDITSEDLKITDSVEITIALPDDMGFDVNDIVYIIHEVNGKGDYVYETTVQGTTGNLYITFTNPHGFSLFTIATDVDIQAEIGNDKFASFSDASRNVADGGTITVLMNDVDAGDINEPISFTVVLDGTATEYPGFVMADGLKMTTEAVEGGVKYTFTKVTSGGYYPSYTPAPEVNIDVDNGSLNDAAQAVGGAVSGGSAELKPVSGYTEAEIAKLQKEGKLNLAIVKKSGYTSAAEKDLIDAAITKSGGAVSGVAVMYFDITPVLRTDDGKVVANVTDTEKAISITLDLSAAMQKAAKDGKVIYVVRAHDGKAEFLSTKLSADKTKVTFSSADFSTFAVVALDEVSSPKTFDAGILLYAGMAVAAATGSAVVIGKKRRAE